jgi:hypothetical protein
MDTISTALTSAWLGAVQRVRSAAYQHFVQQVPQAKPARPDRKLTDVIENALQAAGAKPVQPVAGSQAMGSTSDAGSPHVDRLV